MPSVGPVSFATQSGLTNSANSAASDDAYATANWNAVSGSPTAYHITTNGDFSALPADAVITGVLVEIEAKGGASNQAQIQNVFLQKSGSDISATNLGPANVTDTDAYYSFGGDGNLGGYSNITRAEVLTSTFGVRHRAARQSGGPSSGGYSCDHVRMTVFYTQPVTIEANDSAHAQSSDNTTLVAHTPLSVADTSSAHTSAEAALTAHTPLSVADSAHAQASDAAALTAHTPLAVAACTHTQGSDNATLVAHTPLTPAASTHTHSSAAPILTAHSPLQIANSLQAHTSTSPTPAAHTALSAAASAHGHSSQQAAPAAHTPLTIASCAHAHTAASATLTAHTPLSPASSFHAQSSASPAPASSPAAPQPSQYYPVTLAWLADRTALVFTPTWQEP